MHASTKSRVFLSVAVALGVSALVFGGLGFVLIKNGAYPPEGTGSLGHVGMVIGGVVASFLALVLGLFAAVCISKRSAVLRAGQLAPEADEL
jgi:protein-S-isoprenylcysteine O-methyltransferase Ste14